MLWLQASNEQITIGSERLSPIPDSPEGPAASPERKSDSPTRQAQPSLAPGKDEANLATMQEDGPGGGTALPFGGHPGKLQGYTTLPDPQVKRQIDLCLGKRKRSHNSDADTHACVVVGICCMTLLDIETAI